MKRQRDYSGINEGIFVKKKPVLAKKEPKRSVSAGAKKLAALPTGPAAEYDRRGVKLPARARVGGIITPQ